MADNVYEGMFILDANHYSRDPESSLEADFVVDPGCGRGDFRQPLLGRATPGLPLNGHRKGVYWLTYFKLNSERLIEIQRRCEITDDVLRTLFLKVDARIVETLVAHAKAGTIASYSIPDKEEITAGRPKKVTVEVLAAAKAWDGDKPEVGAE